MSLGRRSVFARRRSAPRPQSRDLDLYWTPWQAPGCEHARVKSGARGLTVDSVVLLRHADVGALRCHYQLTTDLRWRALELRLAIYLSEAAQPEDNLTMLGDGRGGWRVNGRRDERLEGCLDLDIEVTPLTNSLPIRRLGLVEGETSELKVAYVPIPELTPRPAKQSYTCLAPLGPEGGRFRHENPVSGFTADLVVDSDGFLADYPDSFRRLE